jgi:putative ABC transport system permease protein
MSGFWSGVNHLTLVWAGVWRKPTRTLFTVACLVIAFLLFGLLQGVDSAFSQALLQQRLDVLFVDSRFQQPLPMAYAAQIAKVHGVTQLAPIAFLPGSYQDPKNSVFAIATLPDQWLAIRPEYLIPKEQLAAIGRTRTGVIITDWLARQNSWKVGDAVTLVQTPVLTRNGDANWRFEIVGIMRDPDSTVPTSFMLANYEYYDQARVTGNGTVNRFLVRVDDARHAARISRLIDQLFTNSAVQTRTQSEHATVESAIAALGDISFFTRSIIAAAFFTLLVVTGNTMMESIRERTRELAILQTLGFTPTRVLALVLAESLALCLAGSIVGLALAAWAFPQVRFYYVGSSPLPAIVVVTGLALSVGVAVITALIPGWRAMRLSIVNALSTR